MPIDAETTTLSRCFCYMKLAVRLFYASLLCGLSMSVHGSIEDFQMTVIKTGSTEHWSTLPHVVRSRSLAVEFDRILKKKVLQLNGTAHVDLAGLQFELDKVPASSGNNSVVTVAWKQREKKKLLVAFRVSTLNGVRTFVFSQSGIGAPLKKGNTIYIGLEQGHTGNQWVSITRDLSGDLALIEPDNAIIGFGMLSIIGDGRFDEFQLLKRPRNRSNRNRQFVESPIVAQTLQVPVLTGAVASGSDAFDKSEANGKNNQNDVLSGSQDQQDSRIKNLDIESYLVTARNSADRTNVYQDQSTYAGVSIDYRSQGGLRAMVEVFPDYSSLTRPVSNIDFSYTSKDEKETRPFFNAGSEVFSNKSEYFYTPDIPHFNTGLKVYGSNGSSAAGAVLVASPDSRQDLHLTGSYSIDNQSKAGIEAVLGNQQSMSHSLLAANLGSNLRNGLFFNIHGAVAQELIDSGVNDVRSIGGSTDAEFGVNTGGWKLGYKTDHYSSKFNPESANLKADKPGTRGHLLYADHYLQGNKVFGEVNSHVSLSRRSTLEGEVQNDGVFTSTAFKVGNSARVALDYSRFDYRPVSNTQGVFQEQLFQDRYWSLNVDLNIYNSIFGYGGSAADGVLGGGDYRYISGYLWFKPFSDAQISLSSERLVSFGEFHQLSASGSWDISRNASLSGSYTKGDGYTIWDLGVNRNFSKALSVLLSVRRQTDRDNEVVSKLVWSY